MTFNVKQEKIESLLAWSQEQTIVVHITDVVSRMKPFKFSPKALYVDHILNNHLNCTRPSRLKFCSVHAPIAPYNTVCHVQSYGIFLTHWNTHIWYRSQIELVSGLLSWKGVKIIRFFYCWITGKCAYFSENPPCIDPENFYFNVSRSSLKKIPVSQ